MKKFTLLLLFWGFGAFAGGDELSPAKFFNEMRFDNVERVCEEFYAENVVFEDPLGTIGGRKSLIGYYKHMYENLIEIEFKPISEMRNGDEGIFVWQMHLKHKTVGNGENIVVDGVSWFKYENGKVVYHRDYFDLGAMIYEKIPVLGSAIKWIKGKAHGKEEW